MAVTPAVVPTAIPVPAAPVHLAGDVAAGRPRVVVVGDALLDGWLSGPAHRVGRDAPVPVVEVASSSTAPGGAANVAVNLAALGVDVELVTVLGDDADGRDLRAALRAAGVRIEGSVLELGRASTAKRRLVVGGQPVARYDTTPPARPLRGTDLGLADALSATVPGADAVLVADYGLGTLGPRVRRRLARLRDRIPLLVVDAHDLAPWAGLRPDAVTPNAEEAAALLGVPAPTGDRIGWAARHEHPLLRCTGAVSVLLTLDVDGTVALPGPLCRAAPHPAAQGHTCGAGDTFVAAWTAATAVGVPPARALAFAQSAGDVVVAQAGTAVCSTGALAARLAAADRGRLLGHRDLLTVLGEHRRAGHRVVFTNGCFDVLHRGHVAYLRQARELGDVLVVALNGDESVARLKGAARPVNPLEDRAGVVGAVDAVDLVTAFHDDTPVALLESVRPDVYAKGGDYTAQMLPETPVVERLGGQVHVLSYLSDHSTTAIVRRIRAAPTV